MQGGSSSSLNAAPRSKDPKAHTALPTPHRAPRQQWAEAGFTVRYLLALITRVGGHGLPTQGLERREGRRHANQSHKNCTKGPSSDTSH